MGDHGMTYRSIAETIDNSEKFFALRQGLHANLLKADEGVVLVEFQRTQVGRFSITDDVRLRFNAEYQSVGELFEEIRNRLTQYTIENVQG